MANEAMVREYKDLIESQHEAIGACLSTLARQDAEIARLSCELLKAKELAEKRLEYLNRAFVIDPDLPQLPQIIDFLNMCAEGAKDSDTTDSPNGFYDSVLLKRAAIALQSDPCEDCFTKDFIARYIEAETSVK